MWSFQLSLVIVLRECAQDLCTSCFHHLECFCHLSPSFRYQPKCAFSILPDWEKSPITISLRTMNLCSAYHSCSFKLLDYLINVGLPLFCQGTVNLVCFGLQ